MNEWKKIQEQVNELSDKRLNDRLEACCSGMLSEFGTGTVVIEGVSVSIKSALDQIKKSILENYRNKWREKYGEQFIQSVMGKV